MRDLISKLQAASGPLNGMDVEECIRLSPWYADTPAHDPLWSDFVRALQGSIDAALALVERVLPGVRWSRMPDGAVMLYRGNGCFQPILEAPGRAHGASLAILAALLSALISKGDQP